MKANCGILLALALTTSLYAQPAANPPATEAPKSPASPLSSETLASIAKMTPLFDGQTLTGWIQDPTNDTALSAGDITDSPAFVKKLTSWTVKDGALSSLGAGRGVIYTAGEYTHYRIIFNMRHVAPLKGVKSDHEACVLVFCTTPPPGEKGLDALGGIQFQVPNGGTWDYRPGKNNSGKAYFTHPSPAKVDNRQWSQIELLIDARTGTGRMAVAQPPGTKGMEILDFKDPNAGKTGPFALQMHNAGLFDEYKDIRIELDPPDDNLITAQ